MLLDHIEINYFQIEMKTKDEFPTSFCHFHGQIYLGKFFHWILCIDLEPQTLRFRAASFDSGRI